METSFARLCLSANPKEEEENVLIVKIIRMDDEHQRVSNGKLKVLSHSFSMSFETIVSYWSSEIPATNSSSIFSQTSG